jgi:DnaJ-class molecular chaperone
LALQYHPEHNPENAREASEKFMGTNDAYEVLGDELKRWQYDRLTSLSNDPQRTLFVEDMFKEDIGADSILEML